MVPAALEGDDDDDDEEEEEEDEKKDNDDEAAAASLATDFAAARTAFDAYLVSARRWIS